MDLQNAMIINLRRRSESVSFVDKDLALFNKKKDSNLYNSDIDNYMGVKKIRNYIVASINDYEEKIVGQE